MAMLDNLPEGIETRGLTLASLGLAIGTISRLQAKGLLNEADLEHVFGGVLSTMEDFLPPDDPSAKIARGLLAWLHSAALGQNKPPTEQ
jgi:hypothetical protein